MHRSPAERVAAWIATGPVGHGYGGVADWAELFSRYLWSTRRERLQRLRARVRVSRR